MKINICVGSSCHLKGSYDVIKSFKELIKKYNLEDKVELCASFCLGHCANGVACKVDETYLENLNKDNCAEIFEKEILTKV